MRPLISQFLFSALSSASLLLVPTPLQAQSDDERDNDHDVARVAKCFVGSAQYKSLRKKLLTIPISDPRAVENFTSFAQSKCMSDVGNPTATGTEYVGAIYAELYRKLGLETYTQVTRRDSYDSEYDKHSLPLLNSTIELRTYGDCIAIRAPDAAHRFVMAPIWSEAEDAQIAAIAQAANDCGPAPQFAHVDRAGLKGLVAESLYKSAIAKDDD